MKKLLTTLVVAIMLFAMTTTAWATEAGTDFTIEESSGYSYTDNVLTIDTAGEYNIGMAEGVGTTADTIVIADTADVVTLNFDNVKIDTSSDSLAVYAIKGGSGNLTINGTLDVTATSTINAYGIYAKGAITISNTADVTVTAESTTENAYGIYTSAANADIAISGGTVNVNATATTTLSSYKYAYGIYTFSSNADITISDTATVDITAESTNGKANGIYTYYTNANIAISGGTVNVTSDGREAYGIYTSSTGGITISGGTVNANATSTSSYAYGIYASSTNADIAISGGTVNVTATSTSDNAYGISSYSQTSITGGAVNASVNGYDNAYGIRSSANDVTIQGGVVNAIATATTTAYGIDGSSYVAISGGTVDATVKATNAYGIYGKRDSSSSTANVAISGTAMVNVMANGSTGTVNGIYAESTSGSSSAKVTISDSAVVSIAAYGTSSSTVYGIYAENTSGSNSADVTISGTAVVSIAANGSSGTVYGIYAKSASGSYFADVTISDSAAVSVAVKGSVGSTTYGIYAINSATSTNAAITIEGTDSTGGAAVSVYATGSTTYGINTAGTFTISDYSSLKAYGDTAAVYAGANSTIAAGFTIEGGDTAASEAASWDSTDKTYEYNTTTAQYLLIVPTSGATSTYVVNGGGTATESNTALTISDAGTYTISFNTNITTTVKPIVITTDGDVTLNFTNVKIASNSTVIDASGMASIDTLTITGSLDVTTSSTSATYGINASSGNITISDGAKVNALASSASNKACGIYATNGDITIQGTTSGGGTTGGSTVNALASSIGSSAHGIYAKSGDVTISGADTAVNALVTATNGNNYSIYANGSTGITISDGAKVNASVINAEAYVTGICADTGAVEISNATVNVFASTSTGYAYGIYANSGDVTISGADTEVNVTASALASSTYTYGIYANVPQASQFQAVQKSTQLPVAKLQPTAFSHTVAMSQFQVPTQKST